jgi:prepilin-type N-terminal cleavage/methylation domain-containing protein
MKPNRRDRAEKGFSLMELMIAMAVTLVMMSITTELLAQAFSVRRREDRRTEAIADAQRALSIISRELANSGYRLPSDLKYTPPAGTATAVPANGLLPGHCDGDSIAFVSNLNAFDSGASTWARDSVNESDEGVLFTLNNQSLLRVDLSTKNVLAVADRVTNFQITYLNRNGSNAPVAGAVGPDTLAVRLTIAVPLPAIGKPGTSGYQPASEVQVVSEVALRNGALETY